MIIYNITSGQIRNDLAGLGHFHAPRRKKDGEIYVHKGIDLTCNVGQVCWSPITGIIKRKIRIYSDTQRYSGYEIYNDDLCLKVFYINIPDILVGEKIIQGAVLGLAQNINDRYSQCDPHVHTELKWINPLILM